MQSKLTDEALRDRVKKLCCFDEIFDIISLEDCTEELLEKIINQLPQGWHHPEHACAKIKFKDREFLTANYKETPWRLSAAIQAHGEHYGEVAVCYLNEMPARVDGEFLHEEKWLINVVAAGLGIVIERKLAAKSLLEAESNIKLILQHSMDAFSKCNLQTNKYDYISPSIKNVLGYTHDEIMNMSLKEAFSFIHPKDRKGVADVVEKAVSSNSQSYRVDYRFKNKDGNYRWIDDLSRIITDDEGKPLYIVSSVRDITEHKIREDELQMFKTIVENSGIAICASDTEGNMFYANPAHEKIHGRFLNNDGKNNIEKYYTKESLEKIRREIPPLLARGEGWEGELLTYNKSGNCFPVRKRVDWITDADGCAVFGFSVTHDISEYKRLENELKESEKKYRDIVNDVPVGLSRTTLDGRFLNVNRQFVEDLGYDSPEQLISSVTDIAWQVYLNPDDRKMIINFLKKQEYVSDIQIQCKKKDGNILWGLYSARAAKDRDGNIIHLEEIFKNINARKLMEEQLRESEQRNRDLYENEIVAVSIFDGKTLQFLDANETCIKLYGYDKAELLNGMLAIDIAAEKEETMQSIEMILSSGRSHYAAKRMHKKKNGEVFPVSFIAIPSLLKGRRIFYFMSRDISERVNMENELAAYREKLEKMVQERTRKLEEINLSLEEEIRKRNNIELKWEKSEFITNSSEELMILVNRQYVFEAVNDAYCAARGELRRRIIGKNLSEFTGKRIFKKYIKPRLDYCLQGQVINEEAWLKFPVLGKRYFMVSHSPYLGLNGEATHVSVIFHDITDRKKAEDELQLKTRELEEANTALRVVIRQLSEKENITEQKLKFNINEMVIPYIEKLKQQLAGKRLFPVLETLEKNLCDIVSPLMRNLSINHSHLTPQEKHIAEFIKQGKTSQEIAVLLNISIRTVGTHRNNIRKKLKLTNQQSLKSSLLTLQ